MACGCLCPGCGQALIARKGSVRRHHFAHLMPTSCEGGVETVLHRLAKEVFSEIPAIRLPEYRLLLKRTLRGGRTLEHCELVAPARLVRIDSVRIEPHVGQLVPDIVLARRGRELFIEIAVTHLVDRKKLRTLRRSGQATVEIRLDSEDACSRGTSFA
jgi:competence protein CoiA